jgi:hypothetical protein
VANLKSAVLHKFSSVHVDSTPRTMSIIGLAAGRSVEASVLSICLRCIGLNYIEDGGQPCLISIAPNVRKVADVNEKRQMPTFVGIH